MTRKYRCEQGHQWELPGDFTAATAGTSAACPVCGRPSEPQFTPASGLGVESSPPGAGSPSQDAKAARHASRRCVAGYEILGELGRGELGVVHRAYSPKLGRIVALKTLQRIDPAALQRFKAEFRSLAGVSDPNLVALYELVAEGDTWFFAMELVEGVNFLRYVRSGLDDDATDEGGGDSNALTPLRLIRIRWGLAQLVSAVAALHKARVLHRDIKPSNIIVTPEERLVLLDFGLAAELSGEGAYVSTDANVVGTAAYMSPEQAASGDVMQASDWYAVGVVLYEALTGRLPFTGKPLKILMRKSQRDPPPPQTLAADVPDDLNQLCRDLLRRDPQARPGAEEILRRAAATQSGIWARSMAAFRSPDKMPLVGRDRHLAEMHACYAEMERGQAVVLFVQGKSGIGKTALVQEALARLRRRRRAVVLAGRCYEQESVPFKALDSLIDSLCDFLRRLPHAEAVSMMPRDIQALLQVFPVLRRVEAAYDAPRRSLAVADQQELRRRASEALRELLARIGDRRPLVLFVDDLQWGDVDSAVMLCDLLRPPDPPLLWFIGAYRAEDAESSAFLRAFRETEQRALQRLNQRELAVGPLEDTAARQLAELLVGCAPVDSCDDAETVARESGGSPFFARELARYLQSAPSQTARHIDLEAMLVARLEGLPPPARVLMETLAVAGRPTSQHEILAASGVVDDAPLFLARLKAEHLIRVSGTDLEPLLETYHDRIREATLAQIAPPRLPDVHGRLADAIFSSLQVSFGDLARWARIGGTPDGSSPGLDLSSRDWQRVFDLAHHYGVAGQHGQALVFALLAAEQARRQHSLDIAERQYRIASAACAEADPATRYRIARGLGEVWMRRGNYRGARNMLEAARHLAQGEPPLVTAEIEGALGELAFKRGDLIGAATAVERGLSQLGCRVPRRNSAYVLLLLWEIGVQVLHSWFPGRFVGRRPLDRAQRDLLAVRLYSRLGRVCWFSRGRVKGFWTHLREMNLVESYAPTLELAQAYSNHAAAMSVIPWFRRASHYARQSLQIREQFGDLWGQAQTLHFQGVMLYAAARYGECIEMCREAVRRFDRTGDFWELNMARYQLAASLYRLGDLAAASREAWKMHASGLELGDVQASGLSVDLVSKANCGRVPQELMQVELMHDRGSDAQTASMVLQAEGVRLLAAGDDRAAVEAFQAGWDIAHRAGIRNTYVTPCLPWLATALRREAMRLADTDTAQSRRLFKRAWQAVRQGLRLARRFQNDLPHCLRELGLLAAVQGRRRPARRYLEESLRVATQLGARYEHAQTSLALAELERELASPDAQQRIAAAQAAIRDIERPVTGGSDGLQESASK